MHIIALTGVILPNQIAPWWVRLRLAASYVLGYYLSLLWLYPVTFFHYRTFYTFDHNLVHMLRFNLCSILHTHVDTKGYTSLLNMIL